MNVTLGVACQDAEEGRAATRVSYTQLQWPRMFARIAKDTF